MTDREAILAIMHALGALAVRLTGEPLRVAVPTELGDVVLIVGEPQQAEALAHPSVPAGGCAKCC